MWALVYSRMDQAGIRREEGSHCLNIPEATAHKDVVLCATSQQQTTDIRTFSDGVLRRGAAMVDVPDFQFRPVVKEKRSDLGRLGNMQGRLAVTTTSVDDAGCSATSCLNRSNIPRLAAECALICAPRAMR